MKYVTHQKDNFHSSNDTDRYAINSNFLVIGLSKYAGKALLQFSFFVSKQINDGINLFKVCSGNDFPQNENASTHKEKVS